MRNGYLQTIGRNLKSVIEGVLTIFSKCILNPWGIVGGGVHCIIRLLCWSGIQAFLKHIHSGAGVFSKCIIFSNLEGLLSTPFDFSGHKYPFLQTFYLFLDCVLSVHLLKCRKCFITVVTILSQGDAVLWSFSWSEQCPSLQLLTCCNTNKARMPKWWFRNCSIQVIQQLA